MPNKRKKILFTIPNFDTAGSGKAMLKIIQRLDKNLFEPHIACNHDRGAFFKVVKDSGIPVHIMPTTTSMKNKLNGVKTCWKMRKFYREHHFDLVHSYHYSDDYSEALSVRMAGVKWVYHKKNMNWGGNGWKLRSLLANGIFAQNLNIYEDFFKKASKVMYCSSGVDLNEFYPKPPSEDLMKEFNLTPETKVIVNVANLVPLKGIEVLFKAVETMTFPSGSDFRIFIVGDDTTEYGHELKSHAKRLPIPVVFTGKRMDVAAFLSLADFFVFPSFKEASPVSFLEAMASGTYSLGSNIPGLKDQLKELPQQLFKVGDHEDLKHKLELAIQLSQDEMNQVIDHQLKIIREQFSLAIEVEKHEIMYKKLLSIN
jgi:glycosyltransferase involved in cell wall biosynthesis